MIFFCKKCIFSEEYHRLSRPYLAAGGIISVIPSDSALWVHGSILAHLGDTYGYGTYINNLITKLYII